MNIVSDFDVSAYLGVFLEEVDEQLQVLDTEILNLEKDGKNQKTVQNIFRAAHTLKGSSATMGFEEMKEFTHHVENVFDLIRNHQLEVTTEVIDVILESIDFIRELKQGILEGTLHQSDITPLVQKLELIKTKSSKNGLDLVLPETNDEEYIEQESGTVVKFDEFQKSIIKQSIENEFLALAVYVSLTQDAQMKYVRALLIMNNLKEIGEVIAAYPTEEEMEEESFSGKLVFILLTKGTKQEVIQLVNQVSEVNTVSIRRITDKNIESYCAGREIKVQDKPTIEKKVDIEENESKTDGKVKVTPTVRVDVDKLEHLMNLVGELVIDQTRLVDVRNRLVEKNSGEDLETLGEVTNHISRVITELQEGMMKTRMLPIEQLFNRFPRSVRDTAQKAKKEIEFIMQGKETELDRTLVEEIGDPIIHLLRNSIDHGIEPPDEREKLGKNRKGKIVLKAEHQENHIVLSISDDGRGIDAQKVKESCIAKGIISADEASKLSDKELLFLIFRSGVSTAKQVTDISGRGVGMDIVRSHIEKLNGIIDIETTLGQGTTFTIKLPLTLAIIRSLLISIAKRTMAIPLVNVIEIIRLNKDEIKTIKNREMGVVRGRVLPLVRMDRRFGIEQECAQEAEKKRVFVIVVGLADKRIGIVADRTLGNQEIVIKSLGAYIGTPPYIAGATIMGDGNVALIMDVASIVREEGAQDIFEDIGQKNAQLDEEKQFVTFKVGTEEYGIHIDQAKDIIAVPQITKVVSAPKGVLGVINLRGKIIPIVDLRVRFKGKNIENTKKSRIIVVELQGQEVGYLVDEVTQVLKVNLNMIEKAPDASQTKQSDMIEGICNLDQRMIIILKFNKILKKTELNQLDLINDKNEAFS